MTVRRSSSHWGRCAVRIVESVRLPRHRQRRAYRDASGTHIRRWHKNTENAHTRTRACAHGRCRRTGTCASPHAPGPAGPRHPGPHAHFIEFTREVQYHTTDACNNVVSNVLIVLHACVHACVLAGAAGADSMLACLLVPLVLTRHWSRCVGYYDELLQNAAAAQVS